MANLKYSRQREAIKDYLFLCYNTSNGGYCIYAYQEEFPNISLGTVYRNLNLFLLT